MTLTGKALTSGGTTGARTQSDLKINGVDIYDADIATTTFQGKLDAINNFSEQTGVVASAHYEKLFNLGNLTGTWTANDKVYLNGTAYVTGGSIGTLVSNINAIKGTTGISAERKGDNVIISGAFKTITYRNTNNAGTGAAGATYFGAAIAGQAGGVTETYGAIRLDSTANQPISVELGDSSTVAEHGFLEANVGAADYEVNAATLGVSAGSTVAGLSVATESSASKALKTLDNAINTVDAIRSQLGALNNRLDYTVTNLSNIVLNTEAATASWTTCQSV